MTSNIIFEKHKGTLDHKTNVVEFYGIRFQDINVAARYLTGVPPDNYQVWGYENEMGLFINGYFFHNRIWYNETQFKELMGIKE